MGGKPKSESKMYNFKWGLLSLFAVLAFLQIARSVSTTGATGWGKPKVQFPDLYEASVLELQQGLDAGHFSSVDLVKVRYSLRHQHAALPEIGLWTDICRSD